jgi:hypothetical protein
MKRRAFKLVVFLLLGAIVNVAVAWGCTCWSWKPISPIRRTGETRRDALARRSLQIGRVRQCIGA